MSRNLTLGCPLLVLHPTTHSKRGATEDHSVMSGNVKEVEKVLRPPTKASVNKLFMNLIDQKFDVRIWTNILSYFATGCAFEAAEVTSSRNLKTGGPPPLGIRRALTSRLAA